MKRPLIVSLIVVALISVLSLQLISYLTQQEQERTTQHWEITLRALADQQAGQINNWLSSNIQQLEEISNNDSIRLYLQRLLESEDRAQSELAQLTFIRNMLTNSARQFGYQSAQGDIRANIRPGIADTLSFYSSSRKYISGTAGDNLKQHLLLEGFKQVLETGEPVTTPIWSNTKRQSLIGFLVPVKALPAFSKNDAVIGVLIGVRTLDSTVYPEIQNNILSLKSLETLLIQTTNNQTQYASPLLDGSPALSRTAVIDQASIDQATVNLARMTDYDGKNVLLVISDIATPHLSLLVKLSESEAMKESVIQQNFIRSLVIISALFFITIILCAWWYGRTRQQERNARLITEQKNKIAYQSTLLSAINDNISDSILIVDNSKCLMFINNTLALSLNIDTEDASGKNIAAVLGNNYADQLDPMINAVFNNQRAVSEELSLKFRNQKVRFHTTAVHLSYKEQPAVMITLHDITAASEIREKQTRLLQQIISSLMNAIDLHDPYSANHSNKTSLLASAIAHEMHIEKDQKKTLEIAANLCNLGKLFIEKELLTKSGPLSQEEKEKIQSEVHHTHRILDGIDFDGPVLETIIQKYEYLDGSGNAGMIGEEISEIARILIVANDFVAMISPRAYRNKMDPKQALDIMYKMADQKYDRKVIATLFHIVENQLPEELVE